MIQTSVARSAAKLDSRANQNSPCEKRLYLSEFQVAEMTGIVVQTLRNKRFRGEGIPYSKIGRSVRYSLEDVVRCMESHKIRTAAA